MQTDIAIIGSGPVGIFAAFQAGLLGMKSCIIDALDSPGGQCSALYPEKPIFDIPAHPEILAQGLVDNLVEQAAQFDPVYLLSRQVTSMQVAGMRGAGMSDAGVHDAGMHDAGGPDADGCFELETSKGDHVRAKAVIIAAGAGCFGYNRPPLADIKSYEDKSVFYFVDKRDKFASRKILIAGGGDSALDWAISLASIAEVSLVHRRAKFRAAPSSVAKIHELADAGKLELITGFQLEGLSGKDGVLERVTLADLDGNKKHVDADILLPFFGLSQDLGPLLEMGLDIKGHNIKANYPHFETNIPGVYAVGDVATYEGKLKLILSGFSEAASALHHAYARVFDGKALHFEYSTSKVGKK
ncbi:MAG: ferredoxin--NADP(+) reductase [Rickettsiales bacterium]|nr:MAG: ferredoxin--NADP(+) reductase [Rickettsiales bacterium]